MMGDKLDDFNFNLKMLLKRKEYLSALLLSESVLIFILGLYSYHFFMRKDSKNGSEKAKLFSKSERLYDMTINAHLLEMIDKKLFDKLNQFRESRNKHVHEYWMHKFILPNPKKFRGKILLEDVTKTLKKDAEDCAPIVKELFKEFRSFVADKNR